MFGSDDLIDLLFQSAYKLILHEDSTLTMRCQLDNNDNRNILYHKFVDAYSITNLHKTPGIPIQISESSTLFLEPNLNKETTTI